MNKAKKRIIGFISVPVCVAIILLGFTIGVANISFGQTIGSSSSPNQTIGIQVFDSHGLAMSNVSVQGVMYNPPSQGYGTSTVFTAATNSGGHATIHSLNRVIGVMDNWTNYQGSHLNSMGHPDLLLFFTYQSSNTTYFSMGSINMTPYGLTHGKSYNFAAHLPANKQHELVKESHANAHADSISASPSVSQATPDSSTLPSEISDGVYFYWIQDGSPQYTSTMNIPVAAVFIDGNAEAYVHANGATNLNYNVGFALNPGSTSTAEYEAGDGSGYTTNSATTYAYSSGEMVYSSSSGSTGYVWINAQIEGAYYELYYVNEFIFESMNEYFYDTCIVNVQISGGQISSSSAYGVPNSLSNIEGFNTWQTIHTGQQGYGIGDIGTQYYQISSQYLVDQYTGTTPDSAWMSFGLGIGSILVGIVCPPAGVALAVVALLWGTIQWGSGFSASSGYVQYDCPTNYAMNTYAVFSNANYILTNGYQGSVPMLYVEVYAYETSSGSGSGGGGGCVINGTQVSLANGSTISVQNLRPGMKTLSYDTATGSYVDTTVSSVTATNVSNYIEINHMIGISGMADQPVYVMLQNGTKEWIDLGFVNYSMDIFNALQNKWMPVTSLNLINKNITVYDVVTAKQLLTQGKEIINDYIANGVLLDAKTTF